MNETFCSCPIISLLFEIPRSDTKTKCQLIQTALNQLLVKFSNNTFYSLKAQKQSTLRLVSHWKIFEKQIVIGFQASVGFLDVG